MKLRTKLILAFLLFAVVPLTTITVYSYNASTKALRRAVEAESRRATREMERRMERNVATLTRRMGDIEEIPFPAEEAGGGAHAGEGPDPLVVGRMLMALGDAADYVESFEFIQVPPAPQPGVPDKAPSGVEGQVVFEITGTAPESDTVPAAPAPPIVLHLPEIVGKFASNPNLARLMETTQDILSVSGTTPGRYEVRLRAELGRQMKEIAGLVAEQFRAQKEKRVVEVERERSRHLMMKHEIRSRLRRRGETFCHVKANLNSERLLREVLSHVRREEGEIPFARDASGRLFTADPADLPKLEELAAAADPATGDAAGGDGPDGKWVVVTHEDPATGIAFGIARPVGSSLDDLRSTSAQNLLAGLGLAALALFGVLPVTRRMTHNLSDLTQAAERLAAGNFDTQVRVRSRDELGLLARAFNRMARELDANQQRLVEQERLRKELELCRKIQIELLPRQPLTSPFAEVQGVSIPARELGGDFFNYFDLPGGEVALLIGDVSGKGIPAALLMANLQATLKARLPLERDLSGFADRLDREIESTTPAQVYLTLFLGVLDPKRRELRFVNAGHESPFLLRRDGRLERLDPTGRPIGLLPGGGYIEGRIRVESGDRLFLYTDGLVEAENEAGEEFGVKRIAELLGGDDGDPKELLQRVERAYLDHRGKREAADDAALLMLRVGDWAVERGQA